MHCYWYWQHPREWWRIFRQWLAQDLILRAYENGRTTGYHEGQDELAEQAYSREDMQESYNLGRHYERHGN